MPAVIIARAAEHFNLFVFAIASVLVFPSYFFPFADPYQALMCAFAIFALAYIARPLGTIAFAGVQRLHRREARLTLALILLTVSTVGIAFLPGYAQSGSEAILALAVLRIGQGFALGGSWDALPSLLALNAPDDRRGRYAMLGQMGAPLGFVLAGGLFICLLLTLNREEFLAWGWRYPFFISLAFGVVGLFARLRLLSTPEYGRLLAQQEFEPSGATPTVRCHGREIGRAALAPLASYALFHLVTVFPLAWTALHSERAPASLLTTQLTGAVLAVIGVALSGWLTDRFGRRSVMTKSAGAIALFGALSPVLLALGDAGMDAFILLGFCLLGVSCGHASDFIAACFRSRHRFTAAALSTDLAWLAGAAFAPLAALWLATNFGAAYMGFYLIATAGAAWWSLNSGLDQRA